MVAYAGSEVSSMPTWTSPFLSASTVRGPATSSGLNSLNVIPYVFSSPCWQNGRVGHSGGPPSTSWLAIDGPALAGSLAGSLAGAGATVAAVEAAGVAAGVELLPPDVHAPTRSTSDVAPRAAMRVIRIGSSFSDSRTATRGDQAPRCYLLFVFGPDRNSVRLGVRRVTTA